MLRLRDYQTAAITATRQAWARGVRRPAVVLPTGAGKTVVFASLAGEMHGRGVRSLILAHRDELITQAAAKIKAVAPDLRVGIVKAERREIRGRDVVVASVQSLVRAERRAEMAREGFRLVIIDECHHAVADTYMAILRDLGCFDETPADGIGTYALGVTATLGRADRVALGQVWQEVVYRRDIVDLIRLGHLVNVKGVRVRIEGLDLAKVKRVHGDWRNDALGQAMHDALAPTAIARAYIEHAADRAGIVFAPTVAMAYELAEAFTEAGIPAAGIDGAMPMHERRRVLADFSRGDVQVVANCAVLTEGFDAPWCSAVVIARPTSSTPLYVQMAGRGLRPHPGKRDALIIDVAGVTGRHRLASVVDLAGADRVERLPDELAGYEDGEEIDLLGLLDPAGPGGGRLEPTRHDGPLVSEIVDLFTASVRAWLRTGRGVWFLPIDREFVFLAPAPGGEVGQYVVAESSGQSGRFISEPMDLQMAMAWGEQRAASAAGTLTRRKSTWRRAEPTDPQKRMAAALGLSCAGLSKGELSDAISTVKATYRLDAMPVVSGVTERGYW
jgi:superfamily II DNA or RNA helicase